MSDYKRIRDEWYAKLKALGFNDIEQDEDRLKAWHSNRFQKQDGKNNPANHKSKADYYYYATHFLNNHRFEKEIHKIIWEDHSNGVSIRDITDSLNKEGAYKVNRDDVWKIIKHYSKIMKDEI